MEKKSGFRITHDNRLSEFFGKDFSWASILAVIVLLFLVYLFLSGKMTRFYASALFSFYALTKHMWVSVILLGAFQTLIMIPLRVFRVRSSNNVKEFQEIIQAHDDPQLSQKQLKRDFHLGNKTFLFYVVDFTIQLLSFMTIGRLFLTDFYSKMLNPQLLYNFVPYPDYPIRAVFFKIPYLAVTETRQFGWQWILIVWLVLLIFQVVVWVVRSARKRHQPESEGPVAPEYSMPLAGKYGLGYIFLSLLIAVLVMNNFPTGVALQVFTGDVSIPNRTLNAVTALTTFGLILWFGYRRIKHKTELAVAEKIPGRVIFEARKQMFKETFQTSILVGLGAYLITNHIPSAFELSIFTFEIIAVFSPFTLDKLILQTVKKSENSDPTQAESSQEKV